MAMTRIFRIAIILGLTALLAGCANSRPQPVTLFTPTGEPLVDIEAPPGDPVPDATGADGAGDTAETAAVAEAGASPHGAPDVYGITVATLGDATEPGLWIETPFAQIEMPGRVISESGRVVELTLRPSGGALGSGSRISLAAMQALGLSLTDLAILTVNSIQ